MGDQDTIVSP